MSNVSWVVDGLRMDDATANSGFQIVTNLTNQNSTLSVLSARAKSDGNNTNVTCVAEDASSIVTDRRTAFIVLAGEFTNY